MVEELAPGGAADRAGIEVGDLLIDWRCGGGEGTALRGSIDSPFDLTMVEIERTPLCSVVLSGIRDGEQHPIEMPAGEWHVRVRPVIGEALLSSYLEFVNALEHGEVDRASSGLAAAASETRADGDLELAIWLLHRSSLALARNDRPEEADRRRAEAQALAATSGGPLLLHLLVLEGRELLDAERFPQAEVVFGAACERAAEMAPGSLIEAFTLGSRGKAALRAGLLEEAGEYHAKALEIRQVLAPESLVVADSLNSVGNVTFLKGDLEGTEAFYRRSSELRNMLAPKSIEMTASLGNLGNLALMMGDLDGAEESFRKALMISEEIAPDSERVGSGLNNLGMIADQRGDLQAAENLYRQALVIYEEYAPGSQDLGSVLMNLGVIAGERGDLVSAEALFKANLKILERLAPDSLFVAGVLNNLGLVAMERGDLEAAEAFHRRALAINHAMNPTSPDVASSYENLGFVTLLEGDLDEAENMLERSLAINRELAPDSGWVAGSLTNLGKVAEIRGDLEAADSSYREAYEILQRIAPESIQIAGVIWDLGEVAVERGNLEGAAELHREGLAMRRRLAPGGIEEADSLNALGKVQEQLGKEDAVDLLGAAVDLLEAQEGRVGGSAEEKATFRARRHDYYWDYLDLLVERGETDAAYGVLERSRAQVLLDMMATRDLAFSVDIPADLDHERRLADANFQRLQEELLYIPADETEAFEYVSAELRRVRKERDRIRDRIRRASPRFAELSYPEPLGGRAAAAAVDKGTVVLAYAVGEERSHLFVVHRDDPIRVFVIDLGKDRLSEMVRVFRGLVEDPGDSDNREVLHAAAGRLYSSLIGPASHEVAAADRVLIVADGPLHLLPFAALGTTTEAGWRWLVEDRPVSTVTSLTLAKQLRSRRDDSPVKRAVVFADPDYGTSYETATAARRGAGELGALPATRVEAAAIAELFGDGVTTWLGDDATEERVREVGTGIGLLHFAAHVEVDELFPLESGVILSTPSGSDRDDGVLRAWEIFEACRIDADLVTLSGCQTALGREIAGEGLVGLTRAFHYAGARTVLASLWRVEDETTAELMRRFYTNLRSGASTDEALRRAQIDFMRNPVVLPDASTGVLDNLGRWVKGLLGGSDGRTVDASHPFYWAAFRVEGDWK